MSETEVVSKILDKMSNENFTCIAEHRYKSEHYTFDFQQYPFWVEIQRCNHIIFIKELSETECPLVSIRDNGDAFLIEDLKKGVKLIQKIQMFARINCGCRIFREYRYDKD